MDAWGSKFASGFRAPFVDLHFSSKSCVTSKKVCEEEVEREGEGGSKLAVAPDQLQASTSGIQTKDARHVFNGLKRGTPDTHFFTA